MKIILISPVFQQDKATQKQLVLPSLSLHVLAGLTPEEHEVKIVEEVLGIANCDENCDLVGISCFTSNIRRGYELADKFRLRGIPVVMGGIHPTVLPEEALQHADAVVLGEAENVWQDLLEDLKKGKLKKLYRGNYPDLKKHVTLRTRNRKSSHAYGVIPAETSRGCPYTCDFCSVPVHYGRKQRHKPVENVIHDLIEADARKVFFVDDNIMGDPNYSRELMTQLIPLKIKWVSQSTLKVIQKNPDLLILAKKSGCQGLYFGLETISDTSIRILKKNIREKQMISDTLEKVRDSGLFIYTSIIFGFDEDTESVFDESLEFFYKNKIASSSFTHLTPYPGTELFAQLQKNNRIISTNWDDYNHIWGRVVYKPVNFSPEKLYEETLRVKLESVRLGNVMGRFSANWRHPFYYLMLNYGLNYEAKMIKKNRYIKDIDNVFLSNTFS